MESESTSVCSAMVVQLSLLELVPEGRELEVLLAIDGFRETVELGGACADSGPSDSHETCCNTESSTAATVYHRVSGRAAESQ